MDTSEDREELVPGAPAVSIANIEEWIEFVREDGAVLDIAGLGSLPESENELRARVMGILTIAEQLPATGRRENLATLFDRLQEEGLFQIGEGENLREQRLGREVPSTLR